tara:strand:- start:8113 stop:8640 length:528 start_codon:yes stop_codon:yes gene_type:complete
MANGTFYYPSTLQGGDSARARTPNAQWYNGVNPGAGKNIGLGINVDGGALPDITGANSIGMNWTLLDQGYPSDNIPPLPRTPQGACPIGCSANVTRTGNVTTTWDTSQPLYTLSGAASSGGNVPVATIFGEITVGSNPDNVEGSPVEGASPAAVGKVALETLSDGWVAQSLITPY